MKANLLIIAAAVVGLSLSSAIAAEELTIDQIVAKSNFTAYYQGADGRSKVTMKIVDNQGRTRERGMTILRWDQPDPKADPDAPKAEQKYTGEQKFYVFFEEPADVRKMAFLVWKHLDKDDDRWLYLPKIDLVKRIAGSEKRTSFVGSDFFYEDISGRSIEDDAHELTQTSKTYYVLTSTPKDAKSVEFSRYKTWVHRKTFLVVKTEYYDAKSKPYRRYEAKAVGQIQGHWTVTKSRMTDLRTNRYTEITNSSIAYDVGFPESIFTERYLRKPPTKYLKGSEK